MRFAAIFALATAALVSAAPKPDGPDPTKVYVEAMTYGGTGCPQDTVTQVMNAERTLFTLMFSNYIAFARPGSGPGDGRKDCQINFDLRFPPGYSYTIATIDYRGFANVAATHTATQSSVYYFSGYPAQARLGTVFKGPMALDYNLRDVLPVEAWVWAPCGVRVPVNIKTALSINSSADRTKSSMITTDSVDGKVYHIQGLTWKGC